MTHFAARAGTGGLRELPGAALAPPRLSISGNSLAHVICIAIATAHESKMNTRTYNPSVRVGNWIEDLCLEEDLLKDFLEKKDNGLLMIQKTHNFLNTVMKAVRCCVEYLWLGTALMLEWSDKCLRRPRAHQLVHMLIVPGGAPQSTRRLSARRRQSLFAPPPLEDARLCLHVRGAGLRGAPDRTQFSAVLLAAPGALF